MSTDIRLFGVDDKKTPSWRFFFTTFILGLFVTMLVAFGGQGTSSQAIELSIQDTVSTQVEKTAAIAPMGLNSDGTYTVEAGDNLSTIVFKHGLKQGKNWQDLAKQNGLANPDKLAIGQKLVGVGGGSAPAAAPAVAAHVVNAPVVNTADVTSTPAKNNIPKGTCAVPASAWQRVAMKESSGNWGTNTGNGYYGGLQFLPSTWRAYGGVGMPNNASPAQQMAVANRTLAHQGWGAWPNTSRTSGVAAEFPTSQWCNL